MITPYVSQNCFDISDPPGENMGVLWSSFWGKPEQSMLVELDGSSVGVPIAGDLTFTGSRACLWSTWSKAWGPSGNWGMW